MVLSLSLPLSLSLSLSLQGTGFLQPNDVATLAAIELPCLNTPPWIAERGRVFLWSLSTITHFQTRNRTGLNPLLMPPFLVLLLRKSHILCYLQEVCFNITAGLDGRRQCNLLKYCAEMFSSEIINLMK
jgi:hypothetical protein